MHPENLEARKLVGTLHGFNVYTGAHCLGGFIRDDESKHNWLKFAWRRGRGKLARSEKLQGSIPRKFTPW